MERLDEFESITTSYGRSSSLKYQTYYHLLINACVRYDRTKKANIVKEVIFTKQPISQLLSQTPDSDPNMGIDTPSD